MLDLSGSVATVYFHPLAGVLEYSSTLSRVHKIRTCHAQMQTSTHPNGTHEVDAARHKKRRKKENQPERSLS